MGGRSRASTTKSTATTVKHFHCYLLRSLDHRHPNKTYIGFTTDPRRRLRQHNGDLKNGGARRTRRAGRPWGYVAVVHGFADKVAALQFEWAWQNPGKSRHVRAGLAGDHGVARRMGQRYSVKGKLDILRVLLTDCLPFKQYALNVHFVEERWRDVFRKCFLPVSGERLTRGSDFMPASMTCEVRDLKDMPFSMEKQGCTENDIIRKDSITIIDCDEDESSYSCDEEDAGMSSMDENVVNEHPSPRRKRSDGKAEACRTRKGKSSECFICKGAMNATSERPVVCDICFIACHAICLADYMLDESPGSCAVSDLIPQSGPCPSCNADIIWARAIVSARWQTPGDPFPSKTSCAPGCGYRELCAEVTEARPRHVLAPTNSFSLEGSRSDSSLDGKSDASCHFFYEEEDECSPQDVRWMSPFDAERYPPSRSNGRDAKRREERFSKSTETVTTDFIYHYKNCENSFQMCETSSKGDCDLITNGQEETCCSVSHGHDDDHWDGSLTWMSPFDAERYLRSKGTEIEPESAKKIKSNDNLLLEAENNDIDGSAACAAPRNSFNRVVSLSPGSSINGGTDCFSVVDSLDTETTSKHDEVPVGSVPYSRNRSTNGSSSDCHTSKRVINLYCDDDQSVEHERQKRESLEGSRTIDLCSSDCDCF